MHTPTFGYHFSRLHHTKYGDQTKNLTTQWGLTNSQGWLYKHLAGNLPNLCLRMRSVLFSWSETALFFILSHTILEIVPGYFLLRICTAQCSGQAEHLTFTLLNCMLFPFPNNVSIFVLQHFYSISSLNISLRSIIITVFHHSSC